MSKKVKDFAIGQLTASVRLATIANGGVSLAPYHDWESRIPQACKDQVKTAEEAIKANPAITGAK
jgi:basic membrane protein A